jgi:hypothetical protein
MFMRFPRRAALPRGPGMGSARERVPPRGRAPRLVIGLHLLAQIFATPPASNGCPFLQTESARYSSKAHDTL